MQATTFRQSPLPTVPKPASLQRHRNNCTLNSFETYTQRCNSALASGSAAEKTYRPFLVELLQSFNQDSQVEIFDEGKKFKRGYPDIHLRRGSFLVGACETKDISVNLSNYVASDSQHQTNLEDRSSYLVTNYCDFIIYFDHSPTPFYIGSPFFVSGNQISCNPAELDNFVSALEIFLTREQGELGTLQDIIRSIANQAGSIYSVIRRILNADASIFLSQSFEALQQVLVFGLTKDGYADLLAQVMTYREVISWVSCQSDSDTLRGSRLLEGLFAQLPEAPEVWAVIEPILTGIHTTLQDNNSIRDSLLAASNESQDFVYAFYEDFLARYSPEVRSSYGVYYTPSEVCKCVVAIVDDVLRTKLLIREGLNGSTSPGVDSLKIIDPACGTGKFIREIYKLTISNLAEAFQDPSQPFKEVILSSVYGFEILVAPYSISQYLLTSFLNDMGVTLDEGECLPIYLTNSLEGSINTPAAFPFAGWLNNETQNAYNIKNRNDLFVVIGNPPYQGESMNLGDEARRLVSRFKQFRGIPLQEGGTLQLQRNIENDYCKFIGLALRLLSSNRGVLAYVLPNTFLSATSYRGLRESLLEAFDAIYILNINGYVRTRTATDDENVFPNVRDGICLFWGVRTNGITDGSNSCVTYWSLQGRRALKLRILDSVINISDIIDILGEGHQFNPRSSYPSSDLFIPPNPYTTNIYNTFPSLDADIFINRRGAIVTGRDRFVISPSADELYDKMIRLKECSINEIQIVSNELGAEIRGDWTLERATSIRSTLLGMDNSEIRSLIKPILYRPFCFFYIFFLPRALDTPSELVMAPILRIEDNIGLAFGRSTNNTIDNPSHFIVSSRLVEAKAAEYTRQCHFAPAVTFQEILGQIVPQANIQPEFVQHILRPYGMGLEDLDLNPSIGELSSPPGSYGDVLAYIYSCLSSPLWRSVFANEISRDYPRIPLASDRDLLQIMLDKGRQLVRLHLNGSANSMGQYVGDIPASIEYARYEDGRIKINAECAFEGIDEGVWYYKMGGYQVLSQYLRQLRTRGILMNSQYVFEFRRIASTLSETAAIQVSIDETLKEVLLQAYNFSVD